MQTSSILYLNWIWYLLASHIHRSDQAVGCIQLGHLGSPGSHKNMHHAIQSAIGKGYDCSSLVWVLWVRLATQFDFGQRSAPNKHPKQLVTTTYLPHCCHWALLEWKLHSSLGTSWFYCYFHGFLLVKPSPWLSTSCFSMGSWKEQSRTAINKKVKEIAVESQGGGGGVSPFQDKHSTSTQATRVYGVDEIYPGPGHSYLWLIYTSVVRNRSLDT